MSSCDSIDAEIERAISHIDTRTERIRKRELSRALSQLEDLEPAERAAIRRLAERLTEQLLDPPRQSLRTARERDDPEAVRVARELFGD